MQQQKILFEDKDVKVTESNLIIKCYYFPIGTSKTIPLNQIQKVEVRDLGFAKARLWGMDAAAWGYWLPGDMKRCSREQFVAVYTGKWCVPSFTTEHTNVVFNILQTEIQKIKEAQRRQGQPITGVYIQENIKNQDQDSIQKPILQE